MLHVFMGKFGWFGTGDGEFAQPKGIAVDPRGFVYVVDSGNNRIQKFTSDGDFIRK
jgi:DNA-binding beta-propeller fold protein YncE